MKKIIFLFALIAFFSASYSATSLNFAKPAKNSIKATEVYLPIGKKGELISLMDLSQIRVKDYEALTGKEMKFINKVNFKIAQRQLRKNINYDGSLSKKYEKYFGLFTRISWGGLALGIFLSLVGVLIAYLITDENKSNRVRWAWIGAIISLIVWGAILI